jgi:hypothetical protein
MIWVWETALPFPLRLDTRLLQEVGYLSIWVKSNKTVEKIWHLSALQKLFAAAVTAIGQTFLASN